MNSAAPPCLASRAAELEHQAMADGADLQAPRRPRASALIRAPPWRQAPNAKRPASSRRDRPLAPAAAAAQNWRTGSASRNSLAMTIAGPSGACRASAPGDRRAAGQQRLVWILRERRARLDERHVERRRETPARCARRAARRSSACRGPARARSAGPDSARPIDAPHLGRPEPDQLAEHLRDFRRGGEVARARRTDRGSCNSRARDGRARAP